MTCMANDKCWDCGGIDVEFMYQCAKHKGIEFCRACECPYCPEDETGEEANE